MSGERDDPRKPSRILAEVHEAAQELHEASAIDALTMRRFDALCLPPVVLERLREIRAMLGAVKEDTAELRLRVGVIEAGYASMSLRIDRIGGDLELVKRRLDLLDPAIP